MIARKCIFILVKIITMKFIVLSFLFFSTQGFAQQINEKKEKPILKFKTLEIVRNEIPYDSPEQFVFEFKNKGKKIPFLL